MVRLRIKKPRRFLGSERLTFGERRRILGGSRTGAFVTGLFGTPLGDTNKARRRFALQDRRKRLLMLRQRRMRVLAKVKAARRARLRMGF